jgi:hypothetical protein
MTRPLHEGPLTLLNAEIYVMQKFSVAGRSTPYAVRNVCRICVDFGFRNSKNYRIGALLYAGKPNWHVLGSIVVR